MKLRKTIVASTLSIILLLACIMPAYAQENKKTLPSGISHEEIGNEIEKFVTDNVDTTAAMEVAVFDRDGIIYQNCFGYADKEKGIVLCCI